MVIAFEGDDGVLRATGLVRSVERRGADRVISLREGADPQRLLEAAVRAGVEVRRFEVGEPSLHDIFVSLARARG